jgi:hypothetical protein
VGQEYNEKVFSVYTPSILHGVLVGAKLPIDANGLWSAYIGRTRKPKDLTRDISM